MARQEDNEKYWHDGIFLGNGFSVASLEKVKEMDFHPDDLLIATYPKAVLFFTNSPSQKTKLVVLTNFMNKNLTRQSVPIEINWHSCKVNIKTKSQLLQNYYTSFELTLEKYAFPQGPPGCKKLHTS